MKTRVSKTERLFQDGHEVLQHYVKNYEMPDGEDGSIEGGNEFIKNEKVFRSELLERFDVLLRRRERPRRRTVRKS
jgi:hypothetical protein